MEDRFWAKSTEETIVEHTQKLLERYTQLQKKLSRDPSKLGSSSYCLSVS